MNSCDIPEKDRQMLEMLLYLDGIAILLIVTFHSLNGSPGTAFFPFRYYAAYLGLSLFTFSAGFKLVLNHSGELEDPRFLGSYFLRRFVRLYKPYLGYTALVFFPFLAVCYIAWSVLGLRFPGISTFFASIAAVSPEKILWFFAGDNPVTGHLWYLIALIIITATVFTLLLLVNLRLLFILGIPLTGIGFWIFSTTDFFSEPISLRAFMMLPFFLTGGWYAVRHLSEDRLHFTVICRYVSLLVPVLLLLSLFVHESIVSGALMAVLCLGFPCLVISAEQIIRISGPVYSGLVFFGRYAFPIYLFHLPLILLILLRFTGDILGIHASVAPFVIAVVAMVLSVIAYRIVTGVGLGFLIE